jgi:hypothetical protein
LILGQALTTRRPSNNRILAISIAATKSSVVFHPLPNPRRAAARDPADMGNQEGDRKVKAEVSAGDDRSGLVRSAVLFGARFFARVAALSDPQKGRNLYRTDLPGKKTHLFTRNLPRLEFESQIEMICWRLPIRSKRTVLFTQPFTDCSGQGSRRSNLRRICPSGFQFRPTPSRVAIFPSPFPGTQIPAAGFFGRW